MLKDLEQKIKSLAGAPPTIDPSRFGDPVAMKTEWTPAPINGAVGDTLVQVDSTRWEFRASLRAKLAFLVFFLIGMGMLVGFPASKLSSGGMSFDKDTVMFMLIGFVLSISGIYLLYFGTSPVIFDKQKGFFWKGRKAPDEALEGKGIKYCAKLEDIHALQLLSEYCSGPKTPPHYRYGLNLVLKDGTRISVVVDDNKSKAVETANALSQFLGKNLWDAT